MISFVETFTSSLIVLYSKLMIKCFKCELFKPYDYVTNELHSPNPEINIQWDIWWPLHTKGLNSWSPLHLDKILTSKYTTITLVILLDDLVANESNIIFWKKRRKEEEDTLFFSSLLTWNHKQKPLSKETRKKDIWLIFDFDLSWAKHVMITMNIDYRFDF